MSGYTPEPALMQSILIWYMLFHPWIPVNSAWNQFLSVLSNHIPNKILTTRKSLPWITYHLQLQLRKRDKAYNKAKRTNSTTDWATYRRLRNKGVSMLRSVKQTFLKNLSTNFQSLKQFWSVYHSLSINHQRIPPLLTNCSHTVESPYAKANMLNSYFISNFSTNSNLPSSMPSSPAVSTLSEISCSVPTFEMLEDKDCLWPRWYIKQNALRMCLHHSLVPIYPFQVVPLYWHRSHCLENF